MADDLLDIEVTAQHQELASRLGLASIDGDHDRYCQVLAEIVAGGMGTAIAVIGIVNNHLASALANSLGVEAARSVFTRTVLDAGESDQ